MLFELENFFFKNSMNVFSAITIFAENFLKKLQTLLYEYMTLESSGKNVDIKMYEIIQDWKDLEKNDEWRSTKNPKPK